MRTTWLVGVLVLVPLPVAARDMATPDMATQDMAAPAARDARDMPLCRSIVARIREKGGYSRVGGGLADAIAGDPGAPIRFAGTGEPLTPALLSKLPKSDVLQTENATVEHFGSNHAFFAVDSVQGSLHCQNIALFRIVSGGAIQPLEAPPGATTECPQGTMFGSTAGAAPTIPLYVETADTIPNSSMTLWSRRDDAWHSACTIEARYATSLAVGRRSCAKGADCAALESAALALADKRDSIDGEAPKRLGSAELLPKAKGASKDTISLPSFDGGDPDAFSDFESDAPVYALAGPHGPLALRISHGTVGWRTDENWLVGIYEGKDMTPLAGFAITKSRTVLRDVSVR